jgi:hypothetical protein
MPKTIKRARKSEMDAFNRMVDEIAMSALDYRQGKTASKSFMLEMCFWMCKAGNKLPKDEFTMLLDWAESFVRVYRPESLKK